MMRLLGLVVGSILISGLFADVRKKLEACRDNNVDREFLESLDARFPTVQEIETTLCPRILGFMECVENVLKEEMSVTVEEFAEQIPDPVMKDGVIFYINIRSITRDICTEGSYLNTAYEEHGSCFSTINLDDEVCRDNAYTAYEAYKELVDSSEQEITNNELVDNLEEETRKDLERDCLMTAYMSACLASKIHEECGQDAFDLYQQVLKRSSFFRLALCSEAGLEDLQTGFLNSLELEEERHNLFGLAFDLRKRRK